MHSDKITGCLGTKQIKNGFLLQVSSAAGNEAPLGVVKGIYHLAHEYIQTALGQWKDRFFFLCLALDNSLHCLLMYFPPAEPGQGKGNESSFYK